MNLLVWLKIHHTTIVHRSIDDMDKTCLFRTMEFGIY